MITFILNSIIGSEESVVCYELHICVKDSCFGRDDKLIGVSVMQLKAIQNQGNLFLFQFYKLYRRIPFMCVYMM